MAKLSLEEAKKRKAEKLAAEKNTGETSESTNVETTSTDIEKSSNTSVTTTNNNSNVVEVNIRELEQEIQDDVKKSSILNIEGASESTSNVIPDSEQFEMPDETTVIENEADAPVNNDITDDIPDDDFDPLRPSVIKRDYTGDNTQPVQPQPTVNANGTQTPPPPPVEERIIPEPIEKTPPLNDVFPDDDKKKSTGGGGNGNGGGGDKGTGTSGAGGGGNNNGGDNKGTGTGTGSGTGDNKDKDKREKANPHLEDLSPKQKREAAEKTADALLLAYQKTLPVPFKFISNYNIKPRKLQVMEMKDEIELNMTILDDGTTVRQYFNGVNEQVEQTFVVTDAMKNEIREPLIEVLLEQNFALTPSQRLGMAVGGQVIQMGMTAIQFMNQNKEALKQFQKFHQENKQDRANITKAAEEATVAASQVTHEETTTTTHTETTKKTEPVNEPVKEPVKEQAPRYTPPPPDNDDIDDVVEKSTNTTNTEQEDAEIISETKLRREQQMDDYISGGGGINVETGDDIPE